MAVVKGTRAVLRRFGRVLDEEDRRVMGQVIVLVAGAGSVLIIAAGALGLAWRLFGLAAG